MTTIMPTDRRICSQRKSIHKIYVQSKQINREHLSYYIFMMCLSNNSLEKYLYFGTRRAHNNHHHRQHCIGIVGKWDVCQETTSILQKKTFCFDDIWCKYIYACSQGDKKMIHYHITTTIATATEPTYKVNLPCERKGNSASSVDWTNFQHVCLCVFLWCCTNFVGGWNPNHHRNRKQQPSLLRANQVLRTWHERVHKTNSKKNPKNESRWEWELLWKKVI